jgi:hypothetical protein
MTCFIHRWSPWGAPHVVKYIRNAGESVIAAKKTIQARECDRCHLIMARRVYEGGIGAAIDVSDSALEALKKMIDG